MAQFLSHEEMGENDVALLSGIILSVEDDDRATFTLGDASGEVYVYGLWDSPAGEKVSSLSSAGFHSGSEMNIVAFRREFSGRIEAGDAYVYDPATSSIYVSPPRTGISADGAGASVEVSSKGIFTVASSDNWIQLSSASGEAGLKQAFSFNVTANTSLDARKGTITFQDSETSQIQRVLVIQAPGEKALVSIAEATQASYARIRGSVAAVFDGGYILSDDSGNILVKTRYTVGVAPGAVMDVTGSVGKDGYVTHMVPDVAHLTSVGRMVYPTVEGSDVSELTSLLEEAISTGSLPLRYISVRGNLYFNENGSTLSVSKGAATLSLVETAFFNASKYDMQKVQLTGYVLGCSDGMLQVVPVNADGTAKTYITIDGDFSDWDSLPEGSTTEAVCAENAPLKALKKVTFFSDEIYLYMHLLIEEDMIVKSFAPFHIYMDADGSGETGCGLREYSDIGVDYMTEGSLFSGGKIIPYSPSTHLYNGPAGAISWSWTSAGTSGSVCLGDGIDSEYELRLDKSKFTSGPHFATSFRIGINIGDNNWITIGSLPNADATEDNSDGAAPLARITVWDED